MCIRDRQGVGSATIRNEMADLEEMGYLEQPHTSAGRIPSSKGYRLYVDKLMERPKLSRDEELRIKEYLINSAMHLSLIHIYIKIHKGFTSAYNTYYVLFIY